MSHQAVLAKSCQRLVNKRRGRCEHRGFKLVLYPGHVRAVFPHSLGPCNGLRGSRCCPFLNIQQPFRTESSTQELFRIESNIFETSWYSVGLPTQFRPSTTDTSFVTSSALTQTLGPDIHKIVRVLPLYKQQNCKTRVCRGLGVVSHTRLAGVATHDHAPRLSHVSDDSLQNPVPP